MDFGYWIEMLFCIDAFDLEAFDINTCVKTLRVALSLCHDPRFGGWNDCLVFICVKTPCVALTICPRFQI